MRSICMSEGSEHPDPDGERRAPAEHRFLLPTAFGWLLAALCWAALIAFLVWLF